MLFLASCGSEGEEAPSLPPEADDGIMTETYGMEFYFSDSSIVRVRLSSAHSIQKMEGEEGEARKEPVYLFQDGLKIEFLDLAGNVANRITSNQGTYWEKRGLAELKGEVVATDRSGGKKLETEQLFWDEKKEVIYTEEFVRIQEPGKIITGYGFESDTRFDSYRIKKVKGTLYLDPE
jgi:LPS export ABC transporter protein LptC